MTTPNHEKEHATVLTYISGFVLSVVLTLTAYYFVSAHVNSYHSQFSHEFLLIIIAVLAVLQFVVQLRFFLHLGQERKPRLNMISFTFMILVVGILVIGSLWIMKNLDYNMMHQSPDQLEQQITEEGKKGGF